MHGAMIKKRPSITDSVQKPESLSLNLFCRTMRCFSYVRKPSGSDVTQVLSFHSTILIGMFLKEGHHDEH